MVDVLGQGGFGITYLVTGEVRIGNVTTEAKFAVKEHFPAVFCSRRGMDVIPQPDKLADYERSKADFIAEARKLYALGTECDNIVKVNEVFETNGTAYYVMQYINGESLSSYIKHKGKMKFSEALTLLSPVFDAVEFLHKSRINHLDIKPDNIMLHKGINGLVPVLIDFGLSVHFKKNGEKTSPKGVQGVSEGYSPLEQYAGIKEFIPATDIYALMATLLYCITGDTPKSAAEIRLSDVRAALAGLVPPDAIDGICKAMNKSYEDRTSSVALLKSDLGIGPSGGTVTDVIDVSDDSGKKRIWLWTGIASGVILIGVASFFLFSNRGGSSAQTENPALVDTVGSEEAEPIEEAEPVVEILPPVDSTEAGEEIAAENKQPEVTPEPPKPPRPVPQPHVTDGTLQLGYGTWVGGIRNGRPDGSGKLTFSSHHQVDRSTSYQANPGDYFVATYDNGSLISGKLYDRNGNIITTIIP